MKLSHILGCLAVIWYASGQTSAAPVTVIIGTPKETYEIGEAIPVQITIIPASDRAHLQSRAITGLKEVLMVRRSNGDRLGSMAITPRSRLTDETWLPATKNNPLVLETELLSLFPDPYDTDYPHTLDQAGKYTVRYEGKISVRNDPDSADLQWDGVVVSNEIKVHLKSASPRTLANCERMLTSSAASLEEKLVALRFVAGAPGKTALSILQLTVKDPTPMVRVQSVRTLSKLKMGVSFDLVLDTLNDADPFVRAQAVDALGEFDTKRAKAAILAELKSRRERSYRAAIVVLGRIGDDSALPALTEVAQHDETEWVRERALESITKIKSQSRSKGNK